MYTEMCTCIISMCHVHNYTMNVYMYMYNECVQVHNYIMNVYMYMYYGLCMTRLLFT